MNMCPFWGCPVTDKQHDVYFKDYRTVAFYVYFVSLQLQKTLAEIFYPNKSYVSQILTFNGFVAPGIMGTTGPRKTCLKARYIHTYMNFI